MKPGRDERDGKSAGDGGPETGTACIAGVGCCSWSCFRIFTELCGYPI